MPTVSIVCVTYERRHLVTRQVRSLLDQDVDGGVEVIVVDNGSTDGTTQLLEAIAAESDGRLRLIRIDDNRGPARARNLAWRAASGQYIAFTDDDCEVAAEWAAALVSAAKRDGLDVVQGRTLPHPDETDNAGPWSKSQRIESFTWKFETCNLLLRRSVLERHGGFDEFFGVAAGEDTDLGWRVYAAGARVGYAPDAIVYHAVWPRTFAGFLRERGRWADLVVLPRRHPGIRRLYFARYFYRGGHAAVVAGVVVTPLLVTLGLWWIVPLGLLAAVIVRAAIRKDGLRRAAEGLVATAWETLVFARASVRHRSLLL